MKDNFLDNLFSLNGLSITLGATGLISGCVGMFIDLSLLLSVKWLVAFVWCATIVLAVLLKNVYDLRKIVASNERFARPFEHPIKYDEQRKTFVIPANPHFQHDGIVGCYHQEDGIERIAYVGQVLHMQPKVIQIQILRDLKELKQVPTTSEGLKVIKIQPGIPAAAIPALTKE